MEEENKPQPLEYAPPPAKRPELPIERITRLLLAVIVPVLFIPSVVLDGGQLMLAVCLISGPLLIVLGGACLTRTCRARMAGSAVGWIALASGVAILGFLHWRPS